MGVVGRIIFVTPGGVGRGTTGGIAARTGTAATARGTRSRSTGAAAASSSDAAAARDVGGGGTIGLFGNGSDETRRYAKCVEVHWGGVNVIVVFGDVVSDGDVACFVGFFVFCFGVIDGCVDDFFE